MIAYLFLTLFAFDVFADSRQKIVVIDTGVGYKQYKKPYMCKYGNLGSKGWLDGHGHGSNVIGLIGEKIDTDKTCIVSIKLEVDGSKNPEKAIIEAMDMAEKLKPVAVNISWAGAVSFESELKSIIRMVSSGVKVVVAAGNGGISLDTYCGIYPACYLKKMKDMNNIINVSNFIVVGAKDTGSSNTGTVVTVTAIGKDQGYPKMTGTSQATANFTGKLFSK
jgi:subtilisin family serine protease